MELISFCCGQEAPSPMCHTIDGPGIPKTQAGLYAVQAGAPSVYYKKNIYLKGIDAQWQADLADMQNIPSQNGGMI